MFQVVRKFNTRAVVAAAARACAKKQFLAPVTRVATLSQFSQVAKVSALQKRLEHEISEEEANAGQEEPNEDFDAVLAQTKKTFTITETTGSSVVTLTSTFKGEKIEVTFDCQEEIEDPAAQQDMDEEVDENEDENEEFDEDMGETTGIVFSVKITKGDHVLNLDCIAGAALTIDNVVLLTTEQAKSTELDVYSGPKFSELDDQLVEGFYEYLKARKIDDDLSYFILSYAAQKENREYVNWLKNVADFIKK